MLAAVNNTAVNNGVQISVQVSAFDSSGCILRSGIVASYDNAVFNFLRNSHVVFHVTALRYIPTNSGQRLHFLHMLVNTCYFLFLFFSEGRRPNGCDMVSHCGFDFHFPNDCNTEHLFMCLFAICISSLEKYLFMFFLSFYFIFEMESYSIAQAGVPWFNCCSPQSPPPRLK